MFQTNSFLVIALYVVNLVAIFVLKQRLSEGLKNPPKKANKIFYEV